VYRAVQSLPVDSLESFIVDEEWTAKRLLRHIASGADWFLYCLRGGDIQRIQTPSNMTEVANIAKILKVTDTEIIKIGDLDDEMLVINFEGESENHLRSTIVSQAVHHANEHRAQLIGALEFKGYKPILLDDIALWEFESIAPDLM
ncbi:MAG TPA: DinB family protein, partial [archaeon]|nr:DinB family protein [archaeon]